MPLKWFVQDLPNQSECSLFGVCVVSLLRKQITFADYNKINGK